MAPGPAIADLVQDDHRTRINRLNRHRGVATRFDKLAVRFQATIHIAAINEWLRPNL